MNTGGTADRVAMAEKQGALGPADLPPLVPSLPWR